MQTEAYERIRMTITEFETEDVITTSGVINTPGGEIYLPEDIF